MGLIRSKGSWQWNNKSCQEDEVFFFFKNGTSSVFLFRAHLNEKDVQWRAALNIYLCSDRHPNISGYYLGINPLHFSQEPCKGTSPSNRRGTDLMWIPAGRHFNELICIGPISLCAAVIITHAHTHSCTGKRDIPLCSSGNPKDCGTYF